METIGFILYAGLILSVLSFLFLFLGMIGKKEMVLDGYEEEVESEDFGEFKKESKSSAKKKPLFSFGKKKNPNLERLEEEFEEGEEFEDDEFETFEDDNFGDEDENEKDFDFSFEDERFKLKKRGNVNQVGINKFDDEDIDAKEELEIKKYSNDYFEEEEELSDQEKMLKRIEMYKNRLK